MYTLKISQPELKIHTKKVPFKMNIISFTEVPRKAAIFNKYGSQTTFYYTLKKISLRTFYTKRLRCSSSGINTC